MSLQPWGAGGNGTGTKINWPWGHWDKWMGNAHSTGDSFCGEAGSNGQWEMTCTAILHGKLRLSLTHNSGCEFRACPSLPLPKEKGNEDLKGGMM